MSAAWIGLAGVALGGILGLGTSALNNQWERTRRKEDRQRDRAEAKADLCRQACVRYLTSCQILGAWLVVLGLDDAWVQKLKPKTAHAKTAMLMKEDPAKFHEYDASKRQLMLVIVSTIHPAFQEYDGWFMEQVGLFAAASSEDDFHKPFQEWDDAERKLVDAAKRELERLLTEA